MNNVRIWQLINGDWVKLTLKPGKDIEHLTGGPHEEGYSYNVDTWSLSEEENCIHLSCFAWGKDCDGPHESRSELECSLDDLKAFVPCAQTAWNPDGVPLWGMVHSSQRDIYAERMGY